MVRRWEQPRAIWAKRNMNLIILAADVRFSKNCQEQNIHQYSTKFYIVYYQPNSYRPTITPFHYLPTPTPKINRPPPTRAPTSSHFKSIKSTLVERCIINDKTYKTSSKQSRFRTKCTTAKTTASHKINKREEACAAVYSVLTGQLCDYHLLPSI